MSRPKRIELPAEIYNRAYDELKNDIFNYYVKPAYFFAELKKYCNHSGRSEHFYTLIKHFTDKKTTSSSMLKKLTDDQIRSLSDENDFNNCLTKNLKEGNISMMKIVNVFLAKEIVTTKTASPDDDDIKAELMPFMDAFPDIVGVLKNCVNSDNAEFRPADVKVAKKCSEIYCRENNAAYKFNVDDVRKIRFADNAPRNRTGIISESNITPDEMQKYLLDNCNDTYAVAKFISEKIGKSVSHQNVNSYCRQHSIDTRGFPFGYVVGNFVVIKRVGTVKNVPMYKCVCKCGEDFEASNATIFQCIKGGYKYGCPNCRNKCGRRG